MKGFQLLTATMVLAASTASIGAEPDKFTERVLPNSIEMLAPDQRPTITGVNPLLNRNFALAEGRQQVIVRLKGAPVARGGNKQDIEQEQAAFLQSCMDLPGARLIGQVHMVLNAVFLEVDVADLQAIADDPMVSTIKEVSHYELDLSETVPYIGASNVQDFGADGKGISVAVLDSGIDYTHAAFDGAGTLAAYEAAYGTDTAPGGADTRYTILDSQFPSDRVVGGYDFVGEDWPTGPLAPDPDPIPSNDTISQGGHGTHVADIIGGAGGVAPAVDLYAVKVCAAYSGSCNGIALIQGMDFVVDPNGDGDPSDAVDIVNMSLGANYGSPFNDDLSAAVDNATALGVLTVSSAGNGGDKPYVGGTPAGAPTAISVAQTTVPSAGFPLIDVGPLTGILSVFQSWSTPPSGVISEPVVYGGDFGSADGCSVGGDPNDTNAGSEPYPAGTFSGEIVLVDRGTCSFSVKIFNIQRGGGSAGIIGLVTPGAPFSGGFGGGGPFTIPGYMISQADSLAIQGILPADGTIDPDNFLSAAMSMVGSSSRGPQIDDNRIKPEIGAPGASVSASSGTGTGTSAFGGTSGASPMVAGAAALLLDFRDSGKKSKKSKKSKKDITLVEAKSLLMNTAEIDILNDVLVGDLAPVTRIGGGEVRVDTAALSAVSAWDNDDPAAGGGLSFGQVDVAENVVEITKSIRVRNRSNKTIRYNITPTYRTPGPEGSGAVEVIAPSSISVKGNKNGDVKKDTVFDVTLRIDGSLLPGNFMNSGSQGNVGAALTANEFDGYLLFEVDGKSKKSKKSGKSRKSAKDIAGEPIHVAWHVLPRQAAQVVAATNQIAGGGFPVPETIGLDNTGVGIAQNDPYSLLVLSPNIPEGGFGGQAPTPDIASVGINTFPVPAGFCSGQESFLWAFAINSHERQRHLVQPVSYQISLDTDQDGLDDYVILNRDESFNNVNIGRQLSWVFDLNTGDAGAFFFAEHATNTGNTVLLVCGEQLGLSGPDILATNVDITSIFAQDFYYGGPGDEVVFPNKLTVTPLGEQYFGITNDIPGNSAGALDVLDFGPWPGNTPELGVMLITNGDRGAGARGGATESTEVLVFTAPGVEVP